MSTPTASVDADLKVDSMTLGDCQAVGEYSSTRMKALGECSSNKLLR